MHFQTLLAHLLLAASAFAAVDFSAHPYIAPKSSDVRGPCPGLNTLANHGFIPRSGKGLTVSNVLQGAQDGYNMEPDVILLAAKIGFTSGTDLNSFSLEDIRLHDNIEHDASLSRQDFFNGDNFHFNETIFQTLLNSNPGQDVYNTTSAGQVLKARLDIARASNPELKNTAKEFTIRVGESAFYLSVMGNVTSGVAPKKFVQVFFREERLPIAEGWKRSPIPITSDGIETLGIAIANNSDWSPDADQVPTITFFGNTTI